MGPVFCRTHDNIIQIPLVFHLSAVWRFVWNSWLFVVELSEMKFFIDNYKMILCISYDCIIFAGQKK